jgi:glycosyltransferase involved in cell wall biosynthesis
MSISVNPLVSIGMPVRDCENTIAAAIRSIVNQTYEHWELLVVDDGSSDRTLEAVSGFCDPRIRIVYDGLHTGLPARLNQAVRLSRGEYFARMDGDDVSFPERLQRQIAYLGSHPGIDLLASSVVVFRGNGVALGQRLCPARHEELCRRPWASFPMPHPTWMGKAEWFRNHPYDPRAVRAEDQELLLRTYRHSRFAGLEEGLLGYREEQLRLGRISQGRMNYVKAGLRHFLREGEWSNAVALTFGHGLRMLADAVAIESGLEHRLLRHRARPISKALLRRWAAVWQLNRSDETGTVSECGGSYREAVAGRNA